MSQKVLGCLLMGSVLASCALVPPTWTFDRPPREGHSVPADLAVVACETSEAAVAMALTGFYLPGCVDITEVTTFKVTDVALLDEGDGQKLWMVTVETDKLIRYIPLPWHDWA